MCHSCSPSLPTSSDVASSAAAKQAIGIKSVAETEIVERLTAGIDEIYAATNSLDEINTTAHQSEGSAQGAVNTTARVLPKLWLASGCSC